MREKLQAMTSTGGTNPAKLLSINSLFGDDLREGKRFIQEVTRAMENITRDGVMKTLPKYIT